MMDARQIAQSWIDLRELADARLTATTTRHNKRTWAGVVDPHHDYDRGAVLGRRERVLQIRESIVP